jgi:hypothetical protein
MSSGRNEGDNPIRGWTIPDLELEDPLSSHRPRLLPNAGDNTDQCGGCQENVRAVGLLLGGVEGNAIREEGVHKAKLGKGKNANPEIHPA